MCSFLHEARCCQVPCVTDIGTVFMEISPFVLLQDTRPPEKHTKAWHFCFVYDIYKGTDKYRGCVTHQGLAPKKTLSDWTVTAGHGATLNPILFFLFNFCRLARLPCFLAAGSRTGAEMQSQWTKRGRGGAIQQPWCTCVPHHWMNFMTETQRCRQLMWFIHCKWELHPGKKRISSLYKMTPGMKSKRYNQSPWHLKQAHLHRADCGSIASSRHGRHMYAANCFKTIFFITVCHVLMETQRNISAFSAGARTTTLLCSWQPLCKASITSPSSIRTAVAAAAFCSSSLSRADRETNFNLWSELCNRKSAQRQSFPAVCRIKLHMHHDYICIVLCSIMEAIKGH